MAERIQKTAAEVGQRRLSNRLYWECGKQYELQPEKLAWQFWKCDANAFASSARLNNFFSKIEQVKKLGYVLKFSAPKDTEVNASVAATDSSSEAKTTPLKFGQKNL